MPKRVGAYNQLKKMKLKYKVIKGKKVYTLKQEGTKDAHYKFLRIKSSAHHPSEQLHKLHHNQA
jgi:hypothetical protein